MQIVYESIDRGSYVNFKDKVYYEKAPYNTFSRPPVSNSDRVMPTRQEICGHAYLKEGWKQDLERLDNLE